MGRRGWSQERAGCRKDGWKGLQCIFKEAKDQTVLLYLLCFVNSSTYQLMRHVNTTSGNLVSGTDLLIKGECKVKSILAWKKSLQLLTALSWYNVIFHVNAYLSSKRQGRRAGFTLSHLTGAHCRGYALILSPWSLLLGFILCFSIFISSGNLSNDLAWLQR